MPGDDEVDGGDAVDAERRRSSSGRSSGGCRCSPGCRGPRASGCRCRRRSSRRRPRRQNWKQTAPTSQRRESWAWPTGPRIQRCTGSCSHEEDGREQDQVAERAARRRRAASGPAARRRAARRPGSGSTAPASLGDARQLAAIAPDAAERARPDGDGVGRVGDGRRQAEPDQRRERHQRAAAGDRVDGAGHERNGEGKQGVR